MRGNGRVISGALVSAGVCSALTLAGTSAGARQAAAARAPADRPLALSLARAQAAPQPVIVFLKNQPARSHGRPGTRFRPTNGCSSRRPRRPTWDQLQAARRDRRARLPAGRRDRRPGCPPRRSAQLASEPRRGGGDTRRAPIVGARPGRRGARTRRERSAAPPHRRGGRPSARRPGACSAAPQLAPEGLALTSTVSGNATAPTARSLGFTGAGVKVGYIADGLDPDDVDLKRPNGSRSSLTTRTSRGDGPTRRPPAARRSSTPTPSRPGHAVYNVNASPPSPTRHHLHIRIEGVAPGACLSALTSSPATRRRLHTTSMFAQAINYAVRTTR